MAAFYIILTLYILFIAFIGGVIGFLIGKCRKNSYGKRI